MNRELYYTMELQGEGVVLVEPDLAIIQLGVETTDMDLTKAQAENAKIMQSVLSTLMRMDIEEQDIQTESYTINKVYEYVDGKQIDKGYVVRNMLKITLKEIGKVGEVLDAAVASGANVVNGISFETEDPSLYYQKALNMALIDAEEKAISLGRQMRTQVYRVPLRIVEQSFTQVPYGTPLFARSGEAQTPIQTGQNQIIARITALFSYAPM